MALKMVKSVKMCKTAISIYCVASPKVAKARSLNNYTISYQARCLNKYTISDHYFAKTFANLNES